MDPAAWEAMADAIAADIERDIRNLEEHLWGSERPRSFGLFWTRVRELNQQVRVAPAIKLDDKLALQRRLNELCQNARREQRLQRQQASERKQLFVDATALARESLEGAETLAQIQEVRADLAAIRRRVKEEESALRREDAQQVWSAWQALNQEAWYRLNDAWAINERMLSALLDQAQERIERGDSAGAKESIKAFHAAVPEHECSHQSQRALRDRARDLWHDADELGKKKHEAYLAFAGRRLEHWKRLRDRNALSRASLSQEIEVLEEQAGSATTDVGAALVRGRLSERRKALGDMEADDRRLARQIADAQLALGKP